jgi:predicted  nucleic acid-binding Zn-ribbon protein
MSEKVDQFCDNLRGRLNTIEGRLKSLKTNIEAVPNQTEKAVHDKLDEARRKLHSQRGHIDQTRAKFNAWVEEKVTETEEAVSH